MNIKKLNTVMCNSSPIIGLAGPNERYILNIEPQGYLDYKMPGICL